MAALPAVRTAPRPFVPALTLPIAMALALLCVGWLIFFINHISRSISVSNSVDRIAHETEEVIDELMPSPRGPYEINEPVAEYNEMQERLIVSERSGYIRFVDLGFLLERAQT